MPMVRWKKDELSTTGPKGEGGPPQITLAAVESLAVPSVQEVVFSADFRCSRCQRRVAEMMTKLNGETESVVISVLEKKVTLTCTYPNADKLTRHRSSWSNISLLRRLLRSSCTPITSN